MSDGSKSGSDVEDSRDSKGGSSSHNSDEESGEESNSGDVEEEEEEVKETPGRMMPPLINAREAVDVIPCLLLLEE